MTSEDRERVRAEFREALEEVQAFTHRPLVSPGQVRDRAEELQAFAEYSGRREQARRWGRCKGAAEAEIARRRNG